MLYAEREPDGPLIGVWKLVLSTRGEVTKIQLYEILVVIVMY